MQADPLILAGVHIVQQVNDLVDANPPYYLLYVLLVFRPGSSNPLVIMHQLK